MKLPRPTTLAPTPNGEKQRLRRNFQELLNELGIVMFSVQILFGFLFGMVFMPRFTSLNPIERKVHLVALVLAAMTLVLVMAPVIWHRFLMRRQRKAHLVFIGNIALIGAIFCLLGSIGLAIWLVVAITWGDRIATDVTIPIVAACAAAWLVMPVCSLFWREKSEPNHAELASIKSQSPTDPPAED